MGSWANSLHVKHTDAQTVAKAVRALALTSGYQLELAAARAAAGIGATEAAWEGSAPQLPRSVCIYEPSNGWVGILEDGDIQSLARGLSARLDTDTLLVSVNDSDAWGYQLQRRGVEVDSFDSLGNDSDDEAALSPELEAAMERGDEAEIDRLVQRELLDHAPEGPITLADGSALLPPEMALLRDRIRARQASLWERIRYRWLWVRLLFRIGSGGARAGAGFDIPHTTAMSAADLEQHLTQLLNFFPRASESALRRLLPQSRFPAEDVLADFLATVGLPPLYAQLSYAYLEDFDAEQLADGGIVPTAELHFSPAG
jgi:hypothetical protein